ncbi:Disease resistance-like protein DSC1 [Linum grandiflorum]
MSPSMKSANLVGMGSRVLEVERLLAMDTLDDTRIIGLWGMGGVGKTTLAKACYERITSSNKGIKHLFVPNINENCETHQSVEEIVRKLYSKLLSENNIDREDLDINYRLGRLSHLRVFIVLDNVETLHQLEQLALGHVFNINKVFAVGSRILVTTRNRKVLQNAMAKIYNVECLNDEESIRLFSLHAFKPDFPQDNWTDKSRLATLYCKGNPLALKILGGALFGEDMHYWKSFLSGLRQTGKLEIHDILRKSYDKLGEVEKRIFLDVACLLQRVSRSRLIEYMETMYPSSYANVKDLIDRSLLTCVSSENEEKIVVVHELLKEMAWNIVNEEPKLGKRSRNLVVIPNISNSLNLEELILHGCERLVEVPSYVQQLTKLITLDLSGCRNLKRLPLKLDSKFLKHVTMFSCRKVTHCPEIISRELVLFNLLDTSLKELPNAIYNVKQDGELFVSCKNITKFPAITTSLKCFSLRDTSITEIDLHDYQHHHQTCSEILLPKFQNLQFVNNRQLKSLPKSILWNMVSHELFIEGSLLIETLPEISEPVSTGLTDLCISQCGSFKSLPSSIGNITSLKLLYLSEVGVKSLPSSIQELRELHSITLNECKSLETIPSSICKLLNLKDLYMNGCESIRYSPELPPNLVKLDLSGCKSLQALPSNTGQLLHLDQIHFKECPQLDKTGIVENFIDWATLSPVTQIGFFKYREVVCSRSELPDWLPYISKNLKEENCSVKVELPLPNDSDQPMVMKGIAFGLVFSADFYHSSLRLRCDCKVDNTIVAYWRSNFIDLCSGDNSSEVLLLVYYNKHSSRRMRAMESEEEEEE